jgi:heme exporter protein A
VLAYRPEEGVMDSEGPDLLQLEGVSHFFGSRLIFKSLSLRLGPGRILLVAGPNGAGKSTLLRIMAGLVEPSRGMVTCGPGPEKTAYMGHATFLYPRLTALQNLQFWNDMYGICAFEDALLALLKRVNLHGFVHERAGTFSRGMAQRLSLARVLLIDPLLLFLDEPTTGLDTASQDMLFREIEACRKRGGSVVWVSHDVRRDVRRADQVLEIRGGRTVYCGAAGTYAAEGGVHA